MPFFSLPRVKPNKNEEVKRLNNLSSNYSRLFFKEKAGDVDVDLPSVVAERFVTEGKPLTDDVKKLFARSKRLC